MKQPTIKQPPTSKQPLYTILSDLPRLLLSSLMLSSLVLCALSNGALAVDDDMLKQLEMMEQMDEFDRQEFEALLEEADHCSANLDFDCTRERIASAQPLILDPVMQSRLEGSQDYNLDMQGYAGDLIQQSIDNRPLIQFKEICPDPFEDYSHYESEGRDFSRVAERWKARERQHNDFKACAESFDDYFNYREWEQSLNEMQALEEQLDTRAWDEVHDYSSAKDRREIRQLVEQTSEDFEELSEDYLDTMAFIARQNSSSSSSSSTNWMSALNSGLQNINSQMQANNQSFHNNMQALRKDIAQRDKQRREQRQAEISARARAQQQQQNQLAEQQRQRAQQQAQQRQREQAARLRLAQAQAQSQTQSQRPAKPTTPAQRTESRTSAAANVGGKATVERYTGGMRGCVVLLESKRAPGSSAMSSCPASTPNRYSTHFRFRNDCSFPVNIYLDIDYDDGTSKRSGEYDVKSGSVRTTVDYCGLSDYAFHYEEGNDSYFKRR